MIEFRHSVSSLRSDTSFITLFTSITFRLSFNSLTVSLTYSDVS